MGNTDFDKDVKFDKNVKNVPQRGGQEHPSGQRPDQRGSEPGESPDKDTPRAGRADQQGKR